MPSGAIDSKGRPDQRRCGGRQKMSMPHEDRHMSRMVMRNRFISDPHLMIQMIRRVGRHMTARTVINRRLTAGYWSQRPARCPRMSLVQRRRRREWGQRHRVWDLRHRRHGIVCDEPRISLYLSDGRAQVRRRQGERLIDACIQPTHKIAAHQSWSGVQSIIFLDKECNAILHFDF